MDAKHTVVRALTVPGTRYLDDEGAAGRERLKIRGTTPRTMGLAVHSDSGRYRYRHSFASPGRELRWVAVKEDQDPRTAVTGTL